MRFNGLSPEAASNVLAANIVNATAPAKRRLWEPNNEPARAVDFVLWTIAAIAGGAALWLAWTGSPA